MYAKIDLLHHVNLILLLYKLLLNIASDEVEYRHHLELGKLVSTLFHTDEFLSEQSLKPKYKRALKYTDKHCSDNVRLSRM